MKIPDFTNRQPPEIISENLFFDSAGFVYRGLSWLDYVKRTGSITTLLYSALETRLAIENLLFEELIMSVGGQLDRKEYEKCRGKRTKLVKIIRKLNPYYQQLVNFTKTIMTLIPNSPPLIEWEYEKLLDHWRKLSSLLHWTGEIKETVESPQWFVEGLKIVEDAATYLGEKMTSGYSGVMIPETMPQEIRQMWEDLQSGKIDIGTAKERARIALPVLNMRMRT